MLYRSLAKNVDTSDSAIDLRPDPFIPSDQIVVSEYRGGSYTATGNYVSPGGPEEVEIAVTLRNDVIENVDFIRGAETPTSIFFQDKFKLGYKDLVLGKNINEVKLDKVSGSSLTGKGFNEALEKIKSQAKP